MFALVLFKSNDKLSAAPAPTEVLLLEDEPPPVEGVFSAAPTPVERLKSTFV